MRWRRGVREEEQRRQMVAAARGFLEIIPAAVIFETGYRETEQGEKTRVENMSRCTKQTWVKALLSACSFTHSTR